MKKKLQSFSIRLSLRFMFLLTVAVIVFSFVFLLFLRSLVNNSQAQVLKDGTQKVYEAYSEKINPEEEYLVISDIPYYLLYIIYDDSKNVLATNDPFLPLLEETKGKAVHHVVKDFFFDGDLDILYYAEKFSINSAGASQEITIAAAINMDNNSFSELFKNLPAALLLLSIPILLLCFFVSLYITKNTISPVVKITKTAKSMTTENLGCLLPISGRGDEIDELSEAFNDLFLRIKADFERERQFSSDVSHELNTPLTVIFGQANLLLRWGKDNPEQLEKSLNAIKDESKSMHAIIENLLQISRIESGRIKPELSQVKPAESFERISEEFSAVNPQVEFTIEAPQDLTFNTDSEMLHQLLTILVSNSVKFYSGEKQPSITLRAFEQDKKIILEEADNGPGISTEALPHIFERFYRADEAHTRSAGGSGLGLSIAKTLCDALGAEISAENQSAGGVCFRISYIPCRS